MPFDFPSTPTEGQTYTPSGGPTYVYNAPKWKVSAISSGGGSGGAPSGPAGGDLAGTYPNPTVNPEAIDDRVASLLVAGSNVTLSYNDAANSLTIASTAAGGGGGTVTSTSVVSANGLAGTVATPTTTPAITLSTTVNGMVKGDGTALSAATAGTDYVLPATLTTLLDGKVNDTGDTMTGPLVLPLGSASATSLNFGTANTGFIGVSTNELRAITTGVSRLQIGGAIQCMVQVQAPNGTLAAPGIYFAGSTNSGFQRVATNQVSVSNNSLETMRWNADNTTTLFGALTGTTAAFTGEVTAATPATADNDTSVATTAFVKAQSYLTAASAASTYQPLDTDLSAVAALITTGLLTRTASATFQTRTVTGTTNRVTVSNGDGVSGNPTLDISATYDALWQPVDADLTALAGLNATAGLVEQTGAAAFTKRLIGVANTTDIPTRANADARYAPISVTGTVTGVSVVSANGLAGTATATATPAITLSTTITGLLKGNATAISAAVAGTDYMTPANVSGTYLPIANPAFTGTMTGPAVTLSGALAGTTATLSTAISAASNDTTVVTSAWVKANASASIPAIGDFFATGSGGSLNTSTLTAIGALGNIISGNTLSSYASGRYTPPAGRFCIYGWVNAATTSAAGVVAASLSKNGTQILNARSDAITATAGGSASPYVQVTVDANGTDYFELRGYSSVANTISNIGFGAYSISGPPTGIAQNAQTGSYTLVLGDANGHIYHAVAAATATYTIPANASVAYPIGTTVTFVNDSTNAVTIAITTDTLVLSPGTTTGSRTLATGGVATALKVTSTRWVINGSGLT